MQIMDWVYVIDILVAIIVFGYRGMKNGIVPETYFMIATAFSGFAAYFNQFWLGGSLIGSLPIADDLAKALIFAVLFIGIRSILGYLGLVIMGDMRNPVINPQLHKIGGIAFGIVKACYYCSITLVFLDYLNPIFPLLTDPVKNNSFVGFFYQILGSSYDIIFSIVV
jgi:uncharacterized membrane protein required for colicin V production